MRKSLIFTMLLAAAASSVVVAGCSKGESAPTDDSKMRTGMSNKTFDINNVPPEQRDKVRGFMQQSQSGTAPAASAASPAAPAK